MTLLLDNKYECSILKDGYSFSERCGDAGKHATSSVAVSIAPFLGDVNIANYILAHDGYMDAVVKNGDTVIFTGVVRPYLTHNTSGAHSDSISLEVMDYTEVLHEYIWEVGENGEVEGRIYTTIKQDINLSDLLVWLFSLKGKTFTPFSTTDKVFYFKLKAGSYLDDIISELLYEFGLDYRWKADGTAESFSTFIDGQTVEALDDIRGTLAVSRSDDTSDGLKITWKEWTAQTNVKIYSFDSGNMGSAVVGWANPFQTNQAFLTGELWQGAMHDASHNSGAEKPSGNLWSWNFEGTGLKKKDGTSITADDVISLITDQSRITVELLDEEGVDYSVTLESYDVNGMRMWVSYDGQFNVIVGKGWTWRISVYGDICVAVDSEAEYHVEGPSPETVTLEYRMTESNTDVVSTDFVTQLGLRQKYSKMSYSFDSLTVYTVGGFYKIVDPVNGRTTKIRLTSRTQDANGHYSYTAEGAGVLTEDKSLITVTGGGRSYNHKSGQSAYDIAREHGYAGTEAAWIASTLPKPKYWGKRSEAPSIDLLEGDYYLSSADGKVYTYDGSTWSAVDWTADTLASGWGEKFAAALPDMIQLGSNNYTTATILGFFKVLCADEGFIRFLKAYRLIVGSGSDTSGFKFECYDHDADGNEVTPVIRALYNGKTIFEINSSGVYINGTGSLTNAIISGVLKGASGTFTGQFDTPALKSVSKSGGKSVSVSVPANSSRVARCQALYSVYTQRGYDMQPVYVSTYGNCYFYANISGSYYMFYFCKSGLTTVGDIIAEMRCTISNGTVTQAYSTDDSALSAAFTCSYSYGTGDKLYLKDIQEGSAGLESGQVYRDSSGFLKIVF